MSIPPALTRRTAHLVHQRTQNPGLRRVNARLLTDRIPNVEGAAFETLTASETVGAARALGLIATHPYQAHTPRVTFGEAVAALSNEGNAAQQLALLPDLDVTAAARLIDTYMTRTVNEHIAFNLYHLVETLTLWEGNTRRSRAQIIYDYYAAKQH